MTLPTGIATVSKRSGISGLFKGQAGRGGRPGGGFTLLEIVLVTLVIMVVAGMVAPNFTLAWRRMLLKRSVHDAAYLIRYAQSRAITRNVPHRIEFSRDGHEYWITQADPGAGNIIAKGDEAAWSRIEGRYGRVHRIHEGFQVETDPARADVWPDGSLGLFELSACEREVCYFISTKGQRGRVHVYASHNE
jgi:type II secretory pathway pseudopilin PulG